MENEKDVEVKLKTAAQDVLIKKLLKSRKFSDKEYRQLQNIYDSQVTTTYDASVLINYLLAVVQFKRKFLNGKHKAYKVCNYCDGRDKVERFTHLGSGKGIWVCETCGLNLDSSKFVLAKISEENEVSADLKRKELHGELTSAQEDLICEHREQ